MLPRPAAALRRTGFAAAVLIFSALIAESTNDSQVRCSKSCVAENCDTIGIRYGKYCGVGWSGCPGEKPCDELDACCQIHDDCVDVHEVGLGLIGFGIFFTFLAVILFFDRGLLALGNIFWLTGVAILLGWRSTLQVFTDRRNYKGSAAFLLGLFFIFVRWPVVGIIVEIYGCVVLFSGFWPSIKAFLYQIPVLGWIIQYPALLINQFMKS